LETGQGYYHAGRRKNYYRLLGKRTGTDPDALNISDGSGLSPANRVTTLAMAQILQSLKKEPWFDSFYASLPVYNNMKMKSGSIGGVIAYTGYQNSSSG